MNIRRILCPYDFSPHSDGALAHATTFAKEHGAELHIVYVYEEPLPVVDAGVALTVPPADLKPLQDSLKKIKPTNDAVAFRTEFIVGGSPSDELVRYAKGHNIDLIVMGTHGRTGLGRMLMGSVAEAVVRKAPCPVMTLKHPEA